MTATIADRLRQFFAHAGGERGALIDEAVADLRRQQKQIDKYALALTMIREGCADPWTFAAETLEKANQPSGWWRKAAKAIER